MSWTRVDSKKPATKDWKQVLVILQTYQNLGNAQIAGEFPQTSAGQSAERPPGGGFHSETPART